MGKKISPRNLPGVREVIRERGLLSLARRVSGSTLAGELTNLILKDVVGLTKREGRELANIAVNASTAGERLFTGGDNPNLFIKDIPLVPDISSDSIFGDRFQTLVSFEFYDPITGVRGTTTEQIGTDELPTQEAIGAELSEGINDGSIGGSDLKKLADKSEIEIRIISIEAIYRSH